jgi:glycosyltransferase involved in cell wall biosynthesis
MTLKIGILGSRGIPNAYGGFEEFTQHLSAGLVERGHEVFVYNSSLHPYKEKKWNGVNIIHCTDWEDKLDAAGQFIYDFNCIRDARKRNYDILLQLGYTSNSIWHWFWPANAIHIINMDGLEWKRTQYSKPVRRFIKKAEAWAARYADYMIADSPGIQQHILDTYHKSSVFIPYGAEIFTTADVRVLNEYHLQPHQYYLVVSRMEPENNVEMIIKGYLQSKQDHQLVIVGSINKFGKQWKAKYENEKIRFIGAVYDRKVLSNLRYFSKLHFHGHSVGGTNPSLLEAMACQCTMAAHNNVFNTAILKNEACYFSNSTQVSALLNAEDYQNKSAVWKEKNLEKIYHIYNWEKVVDAYEKLMMEAVRIKTGPALTAALHQII